MYRQYENPYDLEKALEKAREEYRKAADDDEGKNASKPRVVFEKPVEGKLRALIWANKDSEDYSEEIEFQ